MDNIVCHPALVYLIIGLIMLSVTIILKLNATDLAITFCQLASVVMFTLILMGLCNIAPEMSWVITTILIICTISTMSAIIFNWITPPSL